MSSRTRAWNNGRLVAEDFSIEAISDHLEDPNTIVWIDLGSPSRELIEQIAGELGLHELAVEDVVEEHQRPKVDYYENHLFLACHATSVTDQGRLESSEIDAFIGDRWLITIRRNGTFDADVLRERWDRVEALTTNGIPTLVYVLLDLVVDGHFASLDRFEDYFDEVSDQLFNGTPMSPTRQREWFDMRRSLAKFHRLTTPMREVLSSLMRRDHSFVPDELLPYYQDIYDHTLRSADTTDSLRNLVSTIVDTDLALRDFRQNQVMKKVGSWAAIFAVPAFITGWFGMNVPFPGDGETWGVALAAGLVVTSCSGLYLWFTARDWL